MPRKSRARTVDLTQPSTWSTVEATEVESELLRAALALVAFAALLVVVKGCVP